MRTVDDRRPARRFGRYCVVRHGHRCLRRRSSRVRRPRPASAGDNDLLTDVQWRRGGVAAGAAVTAATAIGRGSARAWAGDRRSRSAARLRGPRVLLRSAPAYYYDDYDEAPPAATTERHAHRPAATPSRTACSGSGPTTRRAARISATTASGIPARNALTKHSDRALRNSGGPFHLRAARVQSRMPRRADIETALRRLAPDIPPHEFGAVVDHALDSAGLAHRCARSRRLAVAGRLRAPHLHRLRRTARPGLRPRQRAVLRRRRDQRDAAGLGREAETVGPGLGRHRHRQNASTRPPPGPAPTPRRSACGRP